MNIVRSSKDQPYTGIESTHWKIVAATATGAMHNRKNEAGQDAYAIGLIEESWLVAVLCDGAGSVIYGLEGARLCSQQVVNNIVDVVSAFSTEKNGFTPKTVTDCIVHSIENVRQQLSKRIGVLADYAATVVGLVAGPERGYFFHIGDGCGVALPWVDHKTRWEEAILTKPENGEYSNETYFFTDPDWQDHLRITALGTIQQAILMSDGVTHFAMSPGGEQVEERFIAPVCQYLQKTESSQGGKALYGSLASKNANQISDDDKTLIYGKRNCANK